MTAAYAGELGGIPGVGVVCARAFTMFTGSKGMHHCANVPVRATPGRTGTCRPAGCCCRPTRGLATVYVRN